MLIPSASWAISKDWNAKLAVEMLSRWWEDDRFGEASRDWEVLPIAALEYIIPAYLFGNEQFANLLAGRRSISRARTSRSGRLSRRQLQSVGDERHAEGGLTLLSSDQAELPWRMRQLN